VGLVDAFDVLVIAEEVRLAKPDPEIFQVACERLGVAPQQAAHVGDRLDVDAEGALDAGLSAVWLDRGRTRCATLAGTPRPGVHVINDLLELPGLVATIPT
jgi:putative hydrolase of the HAD superfamily